MSAPWIGPRFDETRLLLLGESAYSWESEGEILSPSAQHCTDLVTEVTADFNGCRSYLRFMVKLSRALANNEDPSPSQLRHVWNCVAFTNFVREPVGIGPRLRPTSEMWQQASREFRPLLEDLQPHRVIVLGKGMWSMMPDADVFFTKDVQAYELADGSLSVCWAVLHPSAGLSWQELAGIIHFACGSKLKPDIVANDQAFA